MSKQALILSILPLACLLVVTLGEIRLIFIGFGMRYIHFNTPVIVLAHPWTVAAVQGWSSETSL